MPILSANTPRRKGTTAAPTHADMIRPEPLLVSGPRPATPSAKMLGNMMELKNPQRTNVQMAVWPLVTMETVSSAAAQMPNPPRSFPALILVSTKEPRRRPTIAPNQYSETRKEAVFALLMPCNLK